MAVKSNKKSAYYFSHDFNARTDPKLVKLRVQLGYEAIGVYWSLVEYLYEQNGYLDINELDIIADSLHTNLNLLEKIVKNFELFIVKENSFSSKTIIKRLKERAEKASKLKENAKKRWKKEKTNDMQLHCKDDAIALQTLCNSFPIKERKGKERKEKKRKEKKVISENENFSVVKSDLQIIELNNDFENKISEIKSEWNILAIEYNLAVCLKIVNERKRTLIERLQEKEFDFTRIIEQIKSSDFLLGKNNDKNNDKKNNTFKVNFDWVIKPENYIKILEGKYSNAKLSKTGNNNNEREAFAGGNKI